MQLCNKVATLQFKCILIMDRISLGIRLFSTKSSLSTSQFAQQKSKSMGEAAQAASQVCYSSRSPAANPFIVLS